MRVAILGLITLLSVSSCTNVSQRGGKSTTGDPSVFSGTSFSSVNYTHQLSNVSVSEVAAGGGGNGNNGGAQVSLNLALNTNVPGFKPISQFCGLGTNPCACEVKWKQTNANGEFLYERSRRIPVTTVQSGSVSCLILQANWDEIIPGSVLAIKIIPVGTNASGLNCKGINYRKGEVTNPNGDFLDDTLNAFRNIHRYSCHSKQVAPHEILNRYQNVSKVSSAPTDGSGGSGGGGDTGAPVRTSVGTCFCTATGGGSSGAGACSGLPCPENARSGYSAQNYYRNLYVRSDLLGQINSSNGNYECPKVLESVKTSASSDSTTGLTTIPQSEQNKYWPLDSSFALATQWSPEWSIGIMAGSVLLKPNDPNTTTADTCRNSDALFIENGIFPKCLGFAKPANVDGTCGTMTDSNGNVRPLVRLRRYRAALPPRFQGNGDLQGSGQQQTATFPAVDEVYVADRLVLDQNALPTGDMIYGPKPCNYAWFDHEGVVTRNPLPAQNLFETSVYERVTSGTGTPKLYQGLGIPRYVATSKFFRPSPISPGDPWDPSLSVNPDGLIFPNHDRLGGGIGNRNQASCSASIPVVNYNQGQAHSLSLFTSTSIRPAGDHISLGDYATGTKKIYQNEIHLRPIDPWVPQYLEDTSFKACVPLSSEFTEPPLHFYKDANNNYAWCAEAYPSQNPYWAEINKKRRIFSPTSSTDPDIINAANLVSYPPVAGNTAPPVRGYNSHVNSGFSSQVACGGTLPAQICDMTTPSGAANANCRIYLSRSSDTTATCDRTVIFDPFQNYRDFPILANATDTEDMLKADLANSKTFSCAYSVSKDKSKVNSKYPSTACCGFRSGTRVLDSLITGGGNTGGHLEPLQDSVAPNYRFCGSPVQ